jgi:hypothetical protein
MLAFAVANRGCTEAMAVDLPESSDGFTAYALGNGNKALRVVLINRSTTDVRASVARLGLNGQVTAMRLLAPSGSSKADVTFAGSSVDASGKWKATYAERILDSNVPVPKMSAVVLRN